MSLERGEALEGTLDAQQQSGEPRVEPRDLVVLVERRRERLCVLLLARLHQLLHTNNAHTNTQYNNTHMIFTE